MPSDDLIAGKGQQFGHLWLDDPVCGLMVGVWSCSPMTGKMGPWSTNEMMLLIEGNVAIDHADGTSLDVSAGEAFFIPKGTVCSWRQAGNLKKFFVIHSDGSGLVAPDAAQLKARKIDPSAPLSPTDGPDAALLSGVAPTCQENTAFTDLTGQLTTGIWSACSARRRHRMDQQAADKENLLQFHARFVVVRCCGAKQNGGRTSDRRTIMQGVIDFPQPLPLASARCDLARRRSV
jgi:uncharacterized cupin superfamily protein